MFWDGTKQITNDVDRLRANIFYLHLTNRGIVNLSKCKINPPLFWMVLDRWLLLFSLLSKYFLKENVSKLAWHLFKLTQLYLTTNKYEIPVPVYWNYYIFINDMCIHYTHIITLIWYRIENGMCHYSFVRFSFLVNFFTFLINNTLS